MRECCIGLRVGDDVTAIWQEINYFQFARDILSYEQIL